MSKALTQRTTARLDEQLGRLQAVFPDNASIAPALDLITMEVSAEELLDVAARAKTEPTLAYRQLSDLCGVDYATYGDDEWSTDTEDGASFSRAVEASSIGRLTFDTALDLPSRDRPRFVVVYHLLSIEHNARLRLRCAAPDDELPVVPSVTGIWNNANWYEREAFDLFGILFDGHDDLRRLLTDYGFVGHPFRKDFPLIGNVEMRYDPLKGRVVYEPVSIEPRVLVPRVIRDDARYVTGDEGASDEGAATSPPGASPKADDRGAGKGTDKDADEGTDKDDGSVTGERDGKDDASAAEKRQTPPAQNASDARDTPAADASPESASSDRES